MFLLFVSTFACFITIIYWWFKQSFSYWKNRNIPYLQPKFPVGSLSGVGTHINFSQCMQNIYMKLKGTAPFVGVYFFIKPVALITDLDLVKNILIKDFNTFHDRHVFYNERDDPLSCHLFNIEGLKWKKLRAKLSPTFTSGRMKFMFHTVKEIGERFVVVLNDIVKDSGKDIEIKDILARYTTDVIGTCAFGIECNSLNDPNTEFRKIGDKMIHGRRHGEIVRLLMELYRDIARTLRMKSEQDDVTEFFMGALKETIEHREKNNVRRNDFLDLLIRLKNTGSLDENAEGPINPSNKITFNEIAAQAYVFFGGGFETSSATLGYCLYELVLQPHIQKKAREEINKVLEQYDGKLSYEAMFDMKYLQKVLDETLRKYPLGTELLRVASNDYTVPGIDCVIEKGITVVIPVFSIHRDPLIYPDPEKFDPERFSSEATKDRHPMAYLPFGDGPRNCIGSRFAKMQTYIGLIMLLKNFEFLSCSKTKVPIRFKENSIVLAVKGGLWLRVVKL